MGVSETRAERYRKPQIAFFFNGGNQSTIEFGLTISRHIDQRNGTWNANPGSH